jgi:hypothetical protein
MPLVPLALEQQGYDKLTIGIVSAGVGGSACCRSARASPHSPRASARCRRSSAAVVIGALINCAYTVTSGPWRGQS